MKIARDLIHRVLAGAAAFGMCMYSVHLWIVFGDAEYIFYAALLLVVGWTIVGVVK